MQTVRVRNHAKIKQLNIPSHKVEAIKYIQQTVFGNKRKNSILKDILGHSLCCLCSDAPTIQLEYDLLGGFRKVEYYCDRCASTVYERDEPEDRDSLAAKYGCIAVDSEEQPKTPAE